MLLTGGGGRRAGGRGRRFRGKRSRVLGAHFGEDLKDGVAGGLFGVHVAGEDALETQETDEAGHGKGEGVQETSLVADVVDLFAQLLDVEDVDSEQVDLVGNAGGVDVLRMAAGRGPETRGVVAVFEGIGVAGRRAAFFLGRYFQGHGAAPGGRDEWGYRFIIEYMF